MIRPDHKKYLAFFDILGFEALYNEIGIEEIIIKYEEFISLVSKMEKEAGCCLVNAGGMQMSIMMSIPINYGYFSDTILFWVDADKAPTQVQLINLMEEVLCRSIELGMPLRGSLNAEVTHFDKEKGIFLGKSLICGARAESAQKWIGATLSNSYFSSGAAIDVEKGLPYNKHIKPDKKEFVTNFVIDFPKHWRKTRKEDLITEINRLNKKLEYSIIYENTIDFCRFSEDMENKKWWDTSDFDEIIHPFKRITN